MGGAQRHTLLLWHRRYVRELQESLASFQAKTAAPAVEWEAASPVR